MAGRVQMTLENTNAHAHQTTVENAVNWVSLSLVTCIFIIILQCNILSMLSKIRSRNQQDLFCSYNMQEVKNRKRSFEWGDKILAKRDVSQKLWHGEYPYCRHWTTVLCQQWWLYHMTGKCTSGTLNSMQSINKIDNRDKTISVLECCMFLQGAMPIPLEWTMLRRLFPMHRCRLTTRSPTTSRPMAASKAVTAG